jgi:two-component system, NarL family, response regulator LiaR
MALVNISIIEDDKSYREGLEMVIGNSDYFKVLHSYPSAEIALPHIIHHPPEIVIVDIKLPGKSGVDAIAVIKQQLPNVLCMVCSFYDDNEYIYNALQNGASGYILKDSIPGDMIDSLKDLHQGGAPMSRYIARKVISAFQHKQTLPRLQELSDRENEVLQLIATGLGVKEVSEKMNLSAHTITKHLKNIYNKLHVNNRVEAINRLNQSKYG